MNSLVSGLQTHLANTDAAASNSYALIPNLLPASGFGTTLMVLIWSMVLPRSCSAGRMKQDSPQPGTTTRGQPGAMAQVKYWPVTLRPMPKGAIVTVWKVQAALTHFNAESSRAVNDINWDIAA